MYFDNSQLELYHGRLDKTQGAIAVRFRWYATPDPHLVFIERKTHNDSWTGDISVKERFTLKEHQVLPFMEGEFTVDDKLAEMVNRSEEDKANVRRLFTEIYNQIDSKQLQPTMRVTYMRVAYQIANDPSVRMSLDTNLTMLTENTKLGPPCATTGRWYRDPDLLIPPNEVTRFPHAVLEVKLNLGEGQEVPAWLKDLMDSGLITEVHKFSKFIHGCSTLLPGLVQAVPYWVDDPSIRQSMLRSGEGGGEGGKNPKLAIGDAQERVIMHDYGTMDKEAHFTGLRQRKWGVRNPLSYFRWGGRDVSHEYTSIKPRKIPMKVEPKVFFANERTLLSWLHMSVTLGTISAGLLTLSGSSKGGAASSKVVGMILLPLAVLFVVYALITFHWRMTRIRARVDAHFDDRVGPTVLAVVLMLAYSSVFVVYCM